MTNNPTIDGVSRCKKCRGSGWIDNLRSVGATAAKCPDCAPAVERQEPDDWCDPLQLKAVIQGVVARERMRPESLPDREVSESVYSAITEHLPVYEDVYDQLSEMIEPHVKRPYRIDAPLPASVVDSMRFLLKAYISAPEVAALQSNIAQLQARIGELESGKGEAFAWYTEYYLTDKSATTYDMPTASRWKAKGWPVQPLFTAPPAPVAVVLPERIEPPSDYAYRKGWNACLDATAALNTPQPAEWHDVAGDDEGLVS